MSHAASRRRALLAIFFTCLMLLPFVLGAFLVNVEVAIRVFMPGFFLFSPFFPKGLYDLYVFLSADLSVVSTFVPLLMLVYPLVQSARILRRLDTEPGFAHQLEADPYPQQCGFFFVMLGLTGTLYGMMIGLDVSGVSELAGGAPNQEMIRRSLDKLLGGTATALLSSLVGMIGAFFVAKPIPWLFRRAAGIEADESRRTLSETVARLTEDLRSLSQASRVFAARLKPETADGLFDRLDRQEAAVKEASQYLQQMCALLGAAGQGQAAANHTLDALVGVAGAVRDHAGQSQLRLEAIEKTQAQNLPHLQRLDTFEPVVKSIATLFESSQQQLIQMNQGQQQTHVLVGRMLDGDAARHLEMMGSVAALVGSLQTQREHLEHDQEALRKALAAYLQPQGKTAP
ncbi:MAG: hypothetical protein WCK89_04705 [bacterium]